jgi:DegV family protein with EDD domain
MRIGVVTDSTCDLPKDFIDDNNVTILPISIRIGDRFLVDEHDRAQTLQFYHSDLWSKAHDGESVPYSVEQIKDTFLQRLVLDFDYVFCITVTGSRSPIYANATKASFAILSGYKRVRREAGVEGPFALRVIDSETLFAGQGVMVAETVRQIKEGMPVNKIRDYVVNLRPYIYGYMVPNDLYYLRTRARKKGDNSVGFMQYMIGSTLNIKPVVRSYANETESVYKGRGFEATVEKVMNKTAEQIKRGLKAPTVVAAYGGDPDKIKEMPGYAGLAKTAEEHGINLLLTFMSTTAGVNVGAGAFTVGFAADKHEFK